MVEVREDCGKQDGLQTNEIAVKNGLSLKIFGTYEKFMRCQRLMYGEKFMANNIDGYLVRVACETQGGMVLYQHVS